MEVEARRINPIRTATAVSGVPAYAAIFGIFALITAILSFLIPIIGPLFITPFAIVFGLIALFGGARGMGAATFAIVVVNLIISPTFWVNLYVGGTQADAGFNRSLANFDIFGLALLFIFLIVSSRRRR
jgi:hypothetical protein